MPKKIVIEGVRVYTSGHCVEQLCTPLNKRCLERRERVCLNGCPLGAKASKNLVVEGLGMEGSEVRLADLLKGGKLKRGFQIVPSSDGYKPRAYLVEK